MAEAQHCDQETPEAIPGFPDFGYLSLQGVDNARDLGGMPTEDGFRIKKGLLMRSGDLHRATTEDVHRLVDEHHLVCVVDLRTQSEVDREPDGEALVREVEYQHLPVLSESMVGFGGVPAYDIPHDIKFAQQFTRHPYERMEELYGQAITGELGIHAYTTLLQTLLEVNGKGAVLWHCTQGKDRTGLAAILIEHCLGVSMENMRKDYLATNFYVHGWMERMAHFLENKHLALGLDKAIEAYAYASGCYFDYAMKIYNDVFGSLDAYIEKTLHFSREDRDGLRELCLEKG